MTFSPVVSMEFARLIVSSQQVTEVSGEGEKSPDNPDVRSTAIPANILAFRTITMLLTQIPRTTQLERIDYLEDQIMSSCSCPTDSCWIPVIPVDSGAIPVEFTSQIFAILLFRYLHRNSPRNGPERNGTGMQ
jgi:hypothetical protein